MMEHVLLLTSVSVRYPSGMAVIVSRGGSGAPRQPRCHVMPNVPEYCKSKSKLVYTCMYYVGEDSTMFLILEEGR